MTDREVKVTLSREERYKLRTAEWAGNIDGGPLESVLDKLAAVVVDEPEDVTVTVTLGGKLAEQIEFGTKDDVAARTLWYEVQDQLRDWRAATEAAEQTND